MDLKDKVIVLTGASKGLGREISLLLSKEGAKLALVARKEKDLISLKKEIQDLESEAEIFVCDVSDAKQVSEVVEKVVETFGKIDILINNAGNWFEGYLEDHSPEKIKELFDVITLGTIYFTQAVLPFMKKQKDGLIFNVISMSGLETPGRYGQYSPYTAAKHAVTGFTKSMIEELSGTGVKMLGFYPGGMNTELFRSAGFNYTDNEDWMMDKKDIAEIVIFILKRPKDISMEMTLVKKFNG